MSARSAVRRSGEVENPDAGGGFAQTDAESNITAGKAWPNVWRAGHHLSRSVPTVASNLHRNGVPENSVGSAAMTAASSGGKITTKPSLLSHPKRFCVDIAGKNWPEVSENIVTELVT